jgi:PAS domain S-box-containing protein
MVDPRAPGVPAPAPPAPALADLLDAVIEHLPAMIFVKDARDLAFERVNKAFEELVGVPRAALLGKTDLDFFPREQAEFFRAMDRETLASGAMREALEEPIQTPAGTRWLHTKKVPLHDAEGRAVYLLGISSDVTDRRRTAEELRRARDELELRVDERTAELRHEIAERRRAEQALQESQQRLLQSQKMEAVGRLAGGIAHDFNNMLTVIATYVELIKRGLPSGDRLRPDVDEIGRAAERAANLTRQLLVFSRHQVLEVRVVDLNELVSRMEHMLVRTLGDDVRVVLRPDDRPCRVKVDRGQFEQVVLNLVLNARDAMPQGGELTIRTIAPTEVGERVELTVSDTGIGMDRETQARIFEPFYTTKPIGRGTGLGLATVFAVVAQSDGEVAVESEPGVGSTFRVWLPSARERAPISSVPPVDDGLEGDETILLAEDEPLVRRAVRSMLTGLGYRVLVAGDGPEALRLAAGHGEPIHLLVTDVVMPHMSGAELARRLAEARPDVAVLFVSGYNEEAISTQGVSGTPRGFLQKPFTAQALGRAVREALDARATARG